MTNKTKRTKDNQEFVSDFMQFGSPMNQIFVMDAISKLAKSVLENQDAVRESMKDHFIEPNAWIASAKLWSDKFKENYSS